VAVSAALLLRIWSCHPGPASCPASQCALLRCAYGRISRIQSRFFRAHRHSYLEEKTRRVWLTLVAIAAMMNGIIAYGAFKESLGPRLMSLPDHHCLYCMLQHRPISIGIVGLFVLGIFSCHMAALADPRRCENEAGERLTFLNLNLFKGAVACLLASWLMTVALV